MTSAIGNQPINDFAQDISVGLALAENSSLNSSPKNGYKHIITKLLISTKIVIYDD